MKKLIAVIICISLFAGCKKDPKDNIPSSLKNGLVAYYPFNGNANDESGNGNNGIVNGATLVLDRFSNKNSAYQFYDATGSGGFINVSNPNLPDSFSISVFFDYYFNYLNDNVSSLISNHDHPNGYEFNINYALVKEHYSDLNNAHYCDPFLKINANTWYHYVWTKNKSISKIYLNGQLVSLKENINQITSTNPFLYFGKSAWGGQYI